MTESNDYTYFFKCENTPAYIVVHTFMRWAHGEGDEGEWNYESFATRDWKEQDFNSILCANHALTQCGQAPIATEVLRAAFDLFLDEKRLDDELELFHAAYPKKSWDYSENYRANRLRLLSQKLQHLVKAERNAGDDE